MGAIESYPFTGSSELITDITSSGITLKENNLRVISDGQILESSACLFTTNKIKNINLKDLNENNSMKFSTILALRLDQKKILEKSIYIVLLRCFIN